MINKHMIGRLGNQMFQYATVRAFQLRNNIDDEINLNFDEIFARADEGGFEDSLSYFRIEKYGIKKIKKSFKQKVLLDYLNLIKAFYLVKDKLFKTKKYTKKMYKIEKKLQPMFNKNGIYSFRLGYYEFKNSKVKNKIFYGTFESSKYFDDYKSIIKKEFTPKYDIIAHNKKLYEEINNCESVCVTIRRGDFVNVESIRKNLYICTPKYFDKAIKEIQKKVKKPKFFVFSDDVEWCKENMDFPKGTLYEKGNDPVWEKLRLMYSCKHFILSNSTFSWWAQYLSSNEKKVVVAPSKWTNDSYKNNDEKIDIYEENWTLIDVDKLGE